MQFVAFQLKPFQVDIIAKQTIGQHQIRQIAKQGHCSFMVGIQVFYYPLLLAQMGYSMLTSTPQFVLLKQIQDFGGLHYQAGSPAKMNQRPGFIVNCCIRACSSETGFCWLNCFRRVSEKPLRTSKAVMGFVEGFGTGDIKVVQFIFHLSHGQR